MHGLEDSSAWNRFRAGDLHGFAFFQSTLGLLMDLDLGFRVWGFEITKDV